MDFEASVEQFQNRPRSLVDQYLTSVLCNGPSEDCRYVFELAQGCSIWHALYQAVRRLHHAADWRRFFGQWQISGPGILGNSILEHTAAIISSLERSREYDLQPADLADAVRFVANCCVDNQFNRSLILKPGLVAGLLIQLQHGLDPSLIVPTLYNIVIDVFDLDLNDPIGELTPSDSDIVRREMRGDSSTDRPSPVLLDPNIVLKCPSEFVECLAALIELGVRQSRLQITGRLPAISDHLINTYLVRLLAVDGGKHIAQSSLAARLDMGEAILSVAELQAGQNYLAATGNLLEFAMMVSSEGLHNPLVTPLKALAFRDSGKNAEQFRRDLSDGMAEDCDEADSPYRLLPLQARMLKLVYSICLLSAFNEPPKYGLARQALTMVGFYGHRSAYNRAVAYVCLYNFVNIDTRAHLLVNEGILRCLHHDLDKSDDKDVTYPALALAVKLAVTHILRSLLYQAGLMDVVRHLVLAKGLGYDIPLNAITFYELIIKNSPLHVFELIKRKDDGGFILQDIFVLFRTYNAAICFEIGRLLIECFATLAADIALINGYQGNRLNEFLSHPLLQATDVSEILTFMIRQGHDANPTVAQRVWFGLGLLSASEAGKPIVLQTLRSDGVEQAARRASTSDSKYITDNIKFMLHNMQHNLTSDQAITEDDLSAAMTSMSM